MEEPANNLPCTYLGCVYVEKPAGIDILRTAIEKVSKTVPPDKWLPVIVNISPSAFTITSDNVKYFERNLSYISIFHRDQMNNYSIVVFDIYHFLVWDLIQVFVVLLHIVQIIHLNVMFFIVYHHVFIFVKILKLLAK